MFYSLYAAAAAHDCCKLVVIKEVLYAPQHMKESNLPKSSDGKKKTMSPTVHGTIPLSNPNLIYLFAAFSFYIWYTLSATFHPYTATKEEKKKTQNSSDFFHHLFSCHPQISYYLLSMSKD